MLDHMKLLISIAFDLQNGTDMAQLNICVIILIFHRVKK
jgi:hypothetical protein